MGVLRVLLVNIAKLIFMISTVSSVEICSNKTQIGELVSLSGTRRGGESCGCSVNLVNDNEDSTVTFQATQNPAGCQKKLMLKTKTSEYNCQNYPYHTTFTLTPTDQLYINLVNSQNTLAGFVFNFTIQTETNGSRVNLTCRSLWTTVGGNNLQYSSTTGASGQIDFTTRGTESQNQDLDIPVIVGCIVGGVVLVHIIILMKIFHYK
ncbi:hypothetical protein LOTGIDRAFT_175939 [Lottia gigantea]|uniref:CUB domain-containing protein n=1 Tax=Lottia gigantea TaxID=225164 RepID=V3ZTE5_LOTGI|nr:hypothetical protein LOTGIDRAFT_175939 [Lottia gigantea]ESO87642.1 hypothetical protein LOTGIDRAFT_175939 [Lottia gigantea]